MAAVGPGRWATFGRAVVLLVSWSTRQVQTALVKGGPYPPIGVYLSSIEVIEVLCFSSEIVLLPHFVAFILRQFVACLWG